MTRPDREAAYGPLVFPVQEYERRVERAVALLEEQRLDGLLLTDDRNIFYFSGWGDLVPGGSRARPRFLALTRTGRVAFLLQASNVGSAADMGWIDDISSYSRLERAPIDELVRWLDGLGLARGRLGLELGLEQRLDLPIVDYLALAAALPAAELLDASPVLWRLRMIKSPGEIDRLRQACQITSRAFGRLFAHVQVGQTEVDVSRLFQRSVAEEGGQAGSCFVLAGRGRFGRGNTIATRAPLEPGDLLWVDGGANIGGYKADFSRAGVFGGPTPEQVGLAERMVGVIAAVTREVGPGVAVRDLARRCDEELARVGLPANTGSGRHGHGIGLQVTEPPSLASHDPTVLEPGMVISVEPGYVTEQGRFHFEDDLLVTPAGCEVLSDCDRSLRTL